MKSVRRVFLFVFCLLSFSQFQVFAWKTARTISQGWLYYEPNSKNYLPLSAANANDEVKAISQWIQYSELGYFLRFSAPKGTGVFLDGKLVYVCRFAGSQSIFLKKLPELSKKSEYFLTLYHPNGIQSSGNAELSVPETGDNQLKKIDSFKKSIATMVQKPGYGIRDGLVMAVVLMACGYVATKNASPRTLMTMLNLRDLANFNLSDFAEGQRTALSLTGVFLGLLNSFSVALVLFICLGGKIPEVNLLPEWVFYYGGQGSWVLLANFVVIGILYYLSKTTLIGIAAGIFGIGRLGTAHQYEFMRFTTFLGMICLVVCGFYYLTDYQTPYNLFDLFFYIVAIILIIRALKVSLLLLRSQAFGRLYLISYLCTTEVIPMIFVLKVLAD